MPDDSDFELPDTLEGNESSTSDGLAGVFLGMNIILLYLYFTYGPLIYQNSTSIPDGVHLALGISYILLFAVFLFLAISSLWKIIFKYTSGPSIRDGVSLFVLTLYIPLVTAIAFFGISPIEAIVYVFASLSP